MLIFKDFEKLIKKNSKEQNFIKTLKLLNKLKKKKKLKKLGHCVATIGEKIKYFHNFYQGL